MDPISARMVMAAAGAGATAGLLVEDVFSTFLYEGNATARTITNGIDLAGEGGMVWIKSRDSVYDNSVFDTERGATKWLETNGTSGSSTLTGTLTAFNSDGFDLGSNAVINNSSDNYASWTFRKQPGFFDVVTYTGDGVAGRTVAHNLGSTPGMIMVKNLDASENWAVYHRSQGAAKYGQLNSSLAFSSSNNWWNNTEPTSTEFTVGTKSTVNANGTTYVAYLFAHDDAQFGPNGAESIIKCDTYTGNGSSTGPVIDLGWEPQWVLIKNAGGTGGWSMYDTARGIIYNSFDNELFANSSAAETGPLALNVTPTGFEIKTAAGNVNGSGQAHVYMAIRRPDKAPDTASDFFQITTRTGTSTSIDASLNFNPDFMITKARVSSLGSWNIASRGFPDFHYAELDTTLALTDSSGSRINIRGDIDSTVQYGTSNSVNDNSYTYVDYFWKRARKAFDVVYYEGNGTSGHAVEHGLGAEPQMMLIKRLDLSSNPAIYVRPMGAFYHLLFKAQEARSVGRFTGTHPSSTHFNLGTHSSTNASGGEYVNHLFGNVQGVIDIGSYTGTGSAGLQINCGFAASASLVVIKRYDVAGHWYWFDTSRGIVAGNDPALLSNSGAELTSADYIDPYSSGFEIATTLADLNASGGSYIYMAIA